MTNVLRSLSIGLMIAVYLVLMLLIGLFVYGIAFAPQHVQLSIAAWDILTFESDAAGGFGLTMMGYALYVFMALSVFLGMLWLAIEVLTKRRLPSSKYKPS